jgi:2-polyprenyl-3-methyl-5-hydroxy-6-metoxy-1,4-benzoquinol methylase
MLDDIIAGVILEDVACPNGCAREDETVVVARDLLHGLPGSYSLVRCRQCGLMRTNPRPTASTIGFYYPDDYGPYLGTRVSGQKPENKHGLKQRIQGWLSSRSNELPGMKPGNLLEVGCASGLFLNEMHSRGWHVQGIEFSETAAENARGQGFHVFTGALEVAPRPERRLDLIVAWMVLEHLHEPMECLKKLWDWSEEGGYLVFSIPDINSMAFRIFKQYCYDLHVPNHLYLFNPATIRDLLKSTGWQVEKISHQITIASILASLGFWLRETGREGRLSRWLIDYPSRGGNLPHVLFPLSYLLAKLGQTGRMTVWARKIDA